MIWLDLEGNDGSALYLDVYGIERRGEGEAVYAVSGTFGDGSFEGEVLVEVGAEVEVTFVDEWLDRGRLMDFFGRVSREEVESAMAEALGGSFYCVTNFPSVEGKLRNEVIGFGAGGHGLSLPAAACSHQLQLPIGTAVAA